MGQVVELVFECPRPKAHQLIGTLLETASSVIAFDVDGAPSAWDEQRSIEGMPYTVRSVATMRIDRWELPSLGSIKNVAIRILRLEASFDVEISIDLDDIAVPYPQFVDALFAYACSVADRECVDSYYAGLEPASDEETRLFTGKSKGPLTLPS